MLSPEMTAFMEGVRRRRSELRQAMGDLERALARPANPEWIGRVRQALDRMNGDLRDHVVASEGADGLYAQILADAPHLSARVEHLVREHEALTTAIGALVTAAESDSPDVVALRDQGTDFLVRLSRHRQAGSDLMFDAYDLDVGGET
jgi:hypothetical protein